MKPFAEVRPATGATAAPLAAALLFAPVLLAPARAQTTTTTTQTAPAAARPETPSPADIVVSAPAVSAQEVRAGETVRVSLSLRNQGPLLARSQALAATSVYAQGETFADKGFRGGGTVGYYVAMTLSGPQTGDKWPFRWGLGGDLPLAKIRRVSFPIRLTEPGRYDILYGVGYGDTVRWVGRLPGITVVPAGEALKRTPNLVRPAPPARLTVNGEPVAADQHPVVRDARMLVPVRFLMESLGAYVDWDPAARRVTARRGSYSAQLKIGDDYAQASGKRVSLYPAPFIVDGRTMVPLRFVTEALGGTARYDVRTKTVAVNVPALPGGTDMARR